MTGLSPTQMPRPEDLDRATSLRRRWRGRDRCRASGLAMYQSTHPPAAAETIRWPKMAAHQLGLRRSEDYSPSPSESPGCAHQEATHHRRDRFPRSPGPAIPCEARAPASLVEPPHTDRQQRPCLIPLNAELDRPATHLTVFNVRKLIRSQVDARLQPLAAIRTLHRYKFLGQEPPRNTGARLIHRLESIQPINAAGIQTGDAVPERLEVGGPADRWASFPAFHRAILRDEPCKRLQALPHL